MSDLVGNLEDRFSHVAAHIIYASFFILCCLFILQVDEFHEYVRPIINPKLTKFCSDLTGITQVS